MNTPSWEAGGCIRAKDDDGRISYSVVDEYDTEFTVTPEHSENPLTLAKLVCLIDGGGGGGSLGICYTVMNYNCGEHTIERLDYLKHFTRVDSTFYPQLSLHYESVTQRWYRTERMRLMRRA